MTRTHKKTPARTLARRAGSQEKREAVRRGGQEAAPPAISGKLGEFQRQRGALCAECDNALSRAGVAGLAAAGWTARQAFRYALNLLLLFRVAPLDGWAGVAWAAGSVAGAAEHSEDDPRAAEALLGLAAVVAAFAPARLQVNLPNVDESRRWALSAVQALAMACAASAGGKPEEPAGVVALSRVVDALSALTRAAAWAALEYAHGNERAAAQAGCNLAEGLHLCARVGVEEPHCDLERNAHGRAVEWAAANLLPWPPARVEAARRWEVRFRFGLAPRPAEPATGDDGEADADAEPYDTGRPLGCAPHTAGSACACDDCSAEEAQQRAARLDTLAPGELADRELVRRAIQVRGGPGVWIAVWEIVSTLHRMGTARVWRALHALAREHLLEESERGVGGLTETQRALCPFQTDGRRVMVLVALTEVVP